MAQFKVATLKEHKIRSPSGDVGGSGTRSHIRCGHVAHQSTFASRLHLSFHGSPTESPQHFKFIDATRNLYIQSLGLDLGLPPSCASSSPLNNNSESRRRLRGSSFCLRCVHNYGSIAAFHIRETTSNFESRTPSPFRRYEYRALDIVTGESFHFFWPTTLCGTRTPGRRIKISFLCHGFLISRRPNRTHQILWELVHHTVRTLLSSYETGADLPGVLPSGCVLHLLRTWTSHKRKLVTSGEELALNVEFHAVIFQTVCDATQRAPKNGQAGYGLISVGRRQWFGCCSRHRRRQPSTSTSAQPPDHDDRDRPRLRVVSMASRHFQARAGMRPSI
ncbi:hypothetical protein C8R43DRAFT_1114331 [Mycena crocata]|nr:hypothetical protein C8R43DRAFT_1114331 [Mycena crocata]